MFSARNTAFALLERAPPALIVAIHNPRHRHRHRPRHRPLRRHRIAFVTPLSHVILSSRRILYYPTLSVRPYRLMY